MRLESKKLGIVGFGRIGRAVADRARAFGLQLLVADPFVTAEAAQEVGAVKMELPELLGESEFVTLHSPLMPQTQGMMGKDEFARMRPDSFLINAARGGLIDEDALYDALTSGQIAGAGLDVLVDVDPPLDHRISQLENVIITPHTAFFSQEAVLELEERAAGEVVSIFQGKMPDNLVNPAVLDHSRTKID
jgi:D-3-phosphoglycerate dehydrogenase